MITKKSNQNNKKRPIDSELELSYKGLVGKLKLVSNKQIKLWKALVLTAFVAGFVAALAWAITLSTQKGVDIDIGQMRAQQTDIVNQATATYQDSQGQSYSAQSNIVTISVVGGNTLNLHLDLEGVTDNTSPVTVTIFNPGTASAVLTLTGNTDMNGNFSGDIGSLSGTYDIRVKADFYLSKKSDNIQLPATNTIDFGTLLAGDIQPDNIINTGDFSILSQAWFSSNQLADINKDGLVNTSDFSYLSKNWFMQGS